MVDSEVMLGVLKKNGFRPVADIRLAEVIIINTCGFIQPARRESRKAIRRALNAKRRDPAKNVIVAGCFVERDRESLMAEFPEVDAWTGVTDFHRIDRLVKGLSINESSGTFLYDHRSPRIITTGPSWAYVKISEGCAHRCAFCAIPIIKGPYKSRPVASVLHEARNLASLGIRELDLVSHDSTWYRRDKGERDGLSRLLEALTKVRGLPWIRFLYGYPGEINDRLLEVMSDAKICRYLDLPFQHSHAAVIKAMKRGIDGPRALELLGKIRRKLPGVAIRTSLIVGFPGEGQKEFENLKEFVREARFNHLGVFTYSPERDTPAWPLGDPVSSQEKEARRRELMEIQAGISREIIGSYVGRKIKVIIEGASPKKGVAFRGRARFQAPEVDGIVELSCPEEPSGAFQPIVTAEIVSAGTYDLKGKVVR